MEMNQHDDFRICRDEIKHEYNVLANRLNSYITSQAFLVSAYAISMGNMNPDWGRQFRVAFPVALCIVGILLSLRAHPGIVAVCNVIQAWHDRQDDLFDKYTDIEEYAVLRHRGRAKDNARNLTFAQGATLIFGVGWLYMGGLAYWLSTLPAKVHP